MSCGVDHRRSSDPKLLRLWRRLVATALIRPLAWEPPYAEGSGPRKDKKTKQSRKTNKKPQDDLTLLTLLPVSRGGTWKEPNYNFSF